jgi:hypothetical protein
MIRRLALALAALACAGLFAPVCSAQANLVETFDNAGPTETGQDGPTNLIARGWVFRNQSQPLGPRSWFDGYLPDVQPGWPRPQGGTGYLAVDGLSTDSFGGRISNWAIVPAAAGQRAGDVLTFYTYDSGGSTPPSLEVRYSPTGGTNTGTGVNTVGDFTELLLNIAPLPVGGWVRHQVALPGPGRVALRYFVAQACNFGCFAPYTGLDTLSIGVPPPPPCNLPPQPVAGQTVVWTAAGGPYQLCADMLVPAGATVVVEPGVRVTAQGSYTLTVSGALRGAGTAASPIVFEAPAVYPPLLTLNGGTLELSRAEIRGQVRPNANGTLVLTDSVVVGPTGLVFSDLYAATGFGRIERTTFTDSEMTISSYTLVLRDLTFNNTFVRLVRDYVFFRNLAVEGRSIDFDATPQGTLVDTLSVRNATATYGLGLGGGDFFVGPQVTLQNNREPVFSGGGGILPGSTLPPSGNINNRIFVPGGDTSGGTVWADAGLPYYVDSFYSQRGSPLRILPGVRVLMSPQAGMASDPSEVRVVGTPERPVTFQEAVPGAHWFPLQLFYRIRHGILDGAITGAAWPSNLGWGFMDSSEVRRCTDYGVRGQVAVRKTLFQSNGTGANVSFVRDLLGDTNPNAFEGNTVGVSAASDATLNWWGSPTGPRNQTNPGGTGDPVVTGVPFFPFRTERPDFADAPPIVDLEAHSPLFRPGQKVVVTWDARDDGRIVSQRVLYSSDGDIIQQNLSEPVIVIGDNLPGTQRSVEFVVPEPASRFFGRANLRVEATDDAGQIGWDDLHAKVERDEQGRLVITTTPTAPLVAGQRVGNFCWRADGINPTGGSVDGYLLLENSGVFVSQGGVHTGLTCMALPLDAPMASTDRARLVLTLFTGGGVSAPEFYFSEPFAIRPDARAGDAAPTVAMTGPPAGSSFPGGAVVPIRWTASDDEFVRAIRIQASTDGGRTWSFIAQDLPGTATAFDWRLPPSTGIPDVRIKLIAVDRRFQDTSDVRQILVTPGQGPPPCRVDINGDGLVTIQDFLGYLQAFSSGDAGADFDGNGLVNIQDFLGFLSAYAQGC